MPAGLFQVPAPGKTRLLMFTPGQSASQTNTPCQHDCTLRRAWPSDVHGRWGLERVQPAESRLFSVCDRDQMREVAKLATNARIEARTAARGFVIRRCWVTYTRHVARDESPVESARAASSAKRRASPGLSCTQHTACPGGVSALQSKVYDKTRRSVGLRLKRVGRFGCLRRVVEWLRLEL